MRDIWFWQRIVSPHIAGLAKALAKAGCKVTYVVERDMSEDRKKMGWITPSLEGVELRYARGRARIAAQVSAATTDSVHLCQGLRANGLVYYAQKSLAKRGLQQWVLMEAIDDDGWLGPLKRVVYMMLLWGRREQTSGVLAIGEQTRHWLVSRGAPHTRVFPFAYFLDKIPVFDAVLPEKDRAFRFIFVGQFIDLKCFPILVDALAIASDETTELVVVGSGPLEDQWRAYAEKLLPRRVRWMGIVPSTQIMERLSEVDCLVLPSRHDGWGAVVSEALMSGTPAICSDHCGSAGVVKESGVGGVFKRYDTADLAVLLSNAITAGPPSLHARTNLARWATSLGADAGAQYFLNILAHVEGLEDRPEPPWLRRDTQCTV